MANSDAPMGLWPISHPSGCIRKNVFGNYIIDSNTAGALARGDLVSCEAGGNLELAAANDGIIVVGVFWGCEYIDADGQIHHSAYIPATKTGFTGMKAHVYDDPDLEFGIQADSGTSLTAAAIFATANHVAGTSDSTRKLSGHELDSSDVGTGQQLEILGLVDMPGNDWGEHAKLRVRLNEHKRRAAVAGV
jgi:hypothetical protein